MVIDQLVRESDNLLDAKESVHQIKKNQKKVIFIEQKIRDDHDSTKKRGQISNFEKKLSKLLDIHKENQIHGYFYFVDPSLSKNKNYYNTEIIKLSKSYGVPLKLVYGVELFKDLDIEKVWIELEKYLIRWKQYLPDLPDINFDMAAKKTFEEIKVLDKSIFRKLFEQEKIIQEFFPIIFPSGETLGMLKDYFSQQEGKIYKTLVKEIDKILQNE